jgi:cytochrome c biogenesis protein
MGVGPAFKIRLERSKDAEEFWVLDQFPQFDAFHRKGKYIFVVEDYARYTGLQVRKNPGIWIVWIGCIILIFALIISFFVIPQRLWIRAEPKGRKCSVMIGGITHKHRPTFARLFETLIKKIRGELNVEHKGP